MLMKKSKFIVFIASVMIFFAAGFVIAATEIRFIEPSVEVPLRRGQGNEYKILKLVKSGDRVELLREGENWSEVRLESGSEGWLPTRFLSKQAPPVKQVEILEAENAKLSEQNSLLSGQMQEITGVQTTTGNELSACIAERDTIKNQYLKLQTDSADVMAIKNNADATRKEMEQLQAVLQNVQQQNSELKRRAALTWFLAGGGVLFVGWIIGLITCRSKKRRPSLL